MNPEEVQEKIKQYENFIEDRLKNDLKEIELILKTKVEKHKDWEEVKEMTKLLRTFKEKNRDMAVKVDIGNGFMVQGEISDYERNYIQIGLGYMLEMDCDEADKYSDIRMKLLQKEIAHFRKLAVDIKVHIKLTLLAMSELQGTMIQPLKVN
ncbi:unnamed protein product [Phyllotreta striolata]|uniref:Protein UXT homolog n=1 Tax=Phyllotreta striolata TaxID=444603 RepID=A0A9N9TDM1_PHYSR|nr:unnamed protein product [Phyllotreta striolata]